MDTLMWEAVASDGHSGELIAWLRKAAEQLEARAPGTETELYEDGEGRVVAIVHAPADPVGPVAEFLPPPPEQLSRDPHQWYFRRIKEGS